MSKVVFSEWVPVGSFVKTIVGFVSIVVVFVLSITIVTGMAFENLFWFPIFTFVLLFLFLMFRNYRGIKIQLNENELSVHYGALNRKSIPLINIASCVTTKASFRRYGGVGVRLGLDGSWAYTTSFGEAVKIRCKKGRPFIFSSHNSQKICGIINRIKSRSLN